MIKNMKKYGYIAFVLCVLAGCASQKQISYLQDVPDDYRQKITKDNRETRIMTSGFIRMICFPLW